MDRPIGPMSGTSRARWRSGPNCMNRSAHCRMRCERSSAYCSTYQGMHRGEAAELLGVSLRTLQRRWHDALCKLHRVWNQE
jgi:Bacterial regulatory protein, Fis family